MAPLSSNSSRKCGGVGQVAVVGDGHLAPFAVAGQRLGVAQVRRAGGRIAGVADGHVADEVVQDFAVENLRHQPHAFVFAELAAVARDDARAFLAAMLQGIEAVIGQFRRVGMAVNAEHAAVMFWMTLHLTQLATAHETQPRAPPQAHSRATCPCPVTKKHNNFPQTFNDGMGLAMLRWEK